MLLGIAFISVLTAEALMRKHLPWVVGLLGVGLAALALTVWLYPTQSTKTTVAEASTTTVDGGNATAPTTTRVTKTTTTTAPSETRPATMPALLLGIGILLVLVAIFWNRIQEIGLPGGGSIKLKDAEAPSVDLEDVVNGLQAAPAAGLIGMTSMSRSIIDKATEAYEKGTGVVPVDLGQGDKWVLPNLYFLALVFERWTRVEVLVFTETAGARDQVFVACASPRDLRKQLDVVRPEFNGPAKQAVDGSLNSAGATFFGKLDEQQLVPPGEQPEPLVWVTGESLLELGSDALIKTSIEVEEEDDISRDELLKILAFPHRFVPTTHDKRLVTIVDPAKISRRLARSALR